MGPLVHHRHVVSGVPFTLDAYRRQSRAIGSLDIRYGKRKKCHSVGDYSDGVVFLDFVVLHDFPDSFFAQ